MYDHVCSVKCDAAYLLYTCNTTNAHLTPHFPTFPYLYISLVPTDKAGAGIGRQPSGAAPQGQGATGAAARGADRVRESLWACCTLYGWPAILSKKRDGKCEFLTVLYSVSHHE